MLLYKGHTYIFSFLALGNTRMKLRAKVIGFTTDGCVTLSFGRGMRPDFGTLHIGIDRILDATQSSSSPHR
jgi:hypothetical protein